MSGGGPNGNRRVSDWAWLIEEMKVSKVGADFKLPMPLNTPWDIRKNYVSHVRKICTYHGFRVRFWRLGKLQYVRLEGRFQTVTSVPLQKRER